MAARDWSWGLAADHIHLLGSPVFIEMCHMADVDVLAVI
jgi:hypothetical protein